MLKGIQHTEDKNKHAQKNRRENQSHYHNRSAKEKELNMKTTK
jgi:hypothetical protein